MTTEHARIFFSYQPALTHLEEGPTGTPVEVVDRPADVAVVVQPFETGEPVRYWLSDAPMAAEDVQDLRELLALLVSEAAK